MQVKDIMTANPACCSPDTNLQDVALNVSCQATAEVVQEISEPVG